MTLFLFVHTYVDKIKAFYSILIGVVWCHAAAKWLATLVVK